MQPESTPAAPRTRRTRPSKADLRAFEAFHASHFRELAAYCMVNLRNWADAEEVADDALMTLWRNWRHLRSHDDRTLRAYAFQTVRHRLQRVAPRQRRQRQQTVPLGWGTDDLDDDPALVDATSRDDRPDVLDRRLARLLRAALGKLEPRQRAAVLRRYGDRHTLAEVADDLGTTEAEAGALMRRALRELRALLIGEPTA
jgi:RNA polymerase sigma factor (sigma-70 family)